MKYLVIGQRKKAPNFSAFHYHTKTCGSTGNGDIEYYSKRKIITDSRMVMLESSDLTYSYNTQYTHKTMVGIDIGKVGLFCDQIELLAYYVVFPIRDEIKN